MCLCLQCTISYGTLRGDTTRATPATSGRVRALAGRARLRIRHDYYTVRRRRRQGKANETKRSDSIRNETKREHNAGCGGGRTKAPREMSKWARGAPTCQVVREILRSTCVFPVFSVAQCANEARRFLRLHYILFPSFVLISYCSVR